MTLRQSVSYALIILSIALAILAGRVIGGM
jgi:hypothetical protein